MALESCIKGISWKLRAGSPMPICDSCPCTMKKGSIRYVLQSFGGEKRDTRTYKATSQLLESEDFIGLNPEAQWESAQYNGTQYIDVDGNIEFSGQERGVPVWISEDEIPGVTDFSL
jgi:hypothetical protein